MSTIEATVNEQTSAAYKAQAKDFVDQVASENSSLKEAALRDVIYLRIEQYAETLGKEHPLSVQLDAIKNRIMRHSGDYVFYRGNGNPGH